MHAEAFGFVARAAAQANVTGSVLEIGGRNVNGSVRPLFPTADYTTLDIAPGDGVDIVADGATWQPERTYDCVVCCEVFEHTPAWPDILRTARRALEQGGTLIATCAAPPRAAHSGVDGGPVRDGEWYENVEPERLAKELVACGFEGNVFHHPRGDVYALASVKGE